MCPADAQTFCHSWRHILLRSRQAATQIPGGAAFDFCRSIPMTHSRLPASVRKERSGFIYCDAIVGE